MIRSFNTSTRWKVFVNSGKQGGVAEISRRT
jgi:hypothetical protein